MKYVLLNCWTDKNLGDLGIMISTIEEIRRQDQNAYITGVSCFSEKDSLYEHSHEILKQYVDELKPAIFGVLKVKVGTRTKKTLLSKLIAGMLEFLRMLMVLILPNIISKYLLNSSERETLRVIQDSDISIAKGESVFVDYDSLRGRLGLIRMCMFYLLLHKFSCPYVILGQSFGPVSTKICINLVNRVILNSERTFIREHVCQRTYNKLKLNGEKISFSNDIAFLLSEEYAEVKLTCTDRRKVGFTIRPFSGNLEEDVKYFSKLIAYTINELNFDVHIFLQVSDKTEPDVLVTQMVINSLSKDLLEHVFYYDEGYTPQQLKYLYGRMDIFIGTRLHSTIFAMGAGTLTICHVYQGTKAQGIYENIGLSELVCDTGNYERIKNILEKLLNNFDEYDKKLSEGVERSKKEATLSIKWIIEFVRRGVIKDE